MKLRDFTEPGTYEYREVLTNARRAYPKENYSDDKSSEEDLEHILAEIAGLCGTTPKEGLPQL
jgi:hypothetical protein